MKRRRLSPSARAALLKKQDGRCCVRDCTETRGLIEEHSTPFTWTGALPDQLMCVPCHKEKTRRDVKNIAKVNRLAGKTSSQVSRREKRGRSLIQGKTKIDPRPFDKSLRKRMSGKVERRT